MKIKNILPIVLFLASFSFYAQNEKINEKREKIKAYKVSFLTTELELTSNEAEKFWPIYNAYDDKQFELRHEKMKTYLRKLKDDNVNSLSEKEASALLLLKKITPIKLHQNWLKNTVWQKAKLFRFALNRKTNFSPYKFI